MPKKTKQLKSQSRKISESEQEELMTRAIRAALSLESNPGTLSTDIKKCPNCSCVLKTDSDRDICNNCGYSKCD